MKEITSDGFIETPMSVSASDSVLPMSVDKSSSSVSTLKNDSENLPPSAYNSSYQNSTRDLEHLFDVKEYQQEILEYFREVEVYLKEKG